MNLIVHRSHLLRAANLKRLNIEFELIKSKFGNRKPLGRIPHQIDKSHDNMTVKCIHVHIEHGPHVLDSHTVCFDHTPTQIHEMIIPKS